MEGAVIAGRHDLRQSSGAPHSDNQQHPEDIFLRAFLTCVGLRHPYPRATPTDKHVLLVSYALRQDTTPLQRERLLRHLTRHARRYVPYVPR